MPYPTTAPEGNPYGPQVTFDTLNTFPPSAVYVGPDDALTLFARSPLQPFAILLSYRLLRPDGVIISNNQEFDVLETFGGFQNFNLSPNEGFLLSASLNAVGARRGQCFVQLFIQRGTSVTTPTLAALLCQGYASTIERLSYPGSIPESANSGRGFTRAQGAAIVGLGTPVTQLVPPGCNWFVLAVQATYGTSGAGVPRTPVVRYVFPGGLTAIAIGYPTTLPLVSVVAVNWAVGLQPVVTGNRANGELPYPMLLPSNTQINVSSDGLDPADQIGPVTFTVEEFVGS